MKLRLAPLLEDLAFRFQISSGSASSIFITWVKLCSKELIVLIINYFGQVAIKLRKHCLAALERYTPKFRVSSTVLNALLQHRVVWISLQQCGVNTSTTIPSRRWFAITPNGAVSYVSPAYGGRATDICIVKDSGFLKLLEPYHEVMADRGFKIREELIMRMSTLCIPQSKAAAMQMLPSDVRKTSSIANVRIFVEQAIGRMRVFHILKHELPMHLLSLADDIVRVCGALCNLLPPIAS